MPSDVISTDCRLTWLWLMILVSSPAPVAGDSPTSAGVSPISPSCRLPPTSAAVSSGPLANAAVPLIVILYGFSHFCSRPLEYANPSGPVKMFCVPM